MGAVERLFFLEDDEARRCYVTVARLKAALSNPKIVDGLLDSLGVPGKTATLKKLSPDEKLEGIQRQIEHLRGTATSIWHNTRASDVLAASIWRSDLLSNKLVADGLFSGVRKESDLLKPVASWLSKQKLEVYAEVPLGKKRVDVLGHRPPALAGIISRSFTAIELKNSVKEFERAIDQMTTYADYAHRVYLACTPELAITYLDDHATQHSVHHWDVELLDRKLKKLGLGMLLVEGDRVTEHLAPSTNSIDARKVDEATASMARAARRL